MSQKLLHIAVGIGVVSLAVAFLGFYLSSLVLVAIAAGFIFMAIVSNFFSKSRPLGLPQQLPVVEAQPLESAKGKKKVA